MNETSGVSSNSVGCVISYPPPCGSLNPRDLHCLSSNQDEQNLLQNGQLVQGENQVPESNKDIKAHSKPTISASNLVNDSQSSFAHPDCIIRSCSLPSSRICVPILFNSANTVDYGDRIPDIVKNDLETKNTSNMLLESAKDVSLYSNQILCGKLGIQNSHRQTNKTEDNDAKETIEVFNHQATSLSNNCNEIENILSIDHPETISNIPKNVKETKNYFEIESNLNKEVLQDICDGNESKSEIIQISVIPSSPSNSPTCDNLNKKRRPPLQRGISRNKSDPKILPVS